MIPLNPKDPAAIKALGVYADELQAAGRNWEAEAVRRLTANPCELTLFALASLDYSRVTLAAGTCDYFANHLVGEPTTLLGVANLADLFAPPGTRLWFRFPPLPPRSPSTVTTTDRGKPEAPSSSDTSPPDTTPPDTTPRKSVTDPDEWYGNEPQASISE